LTEEAALAHGLRLNALTRYLGPDAIYDPELYIFALHQGDIIILCTDGVHRGTSNEEIGQLAQYRESPDLAATLLWLTVSENVDDKTAIVIVVA